MPARSIGAPPPRPPVVKPKPAKKPLPKTELKKPSARDSVGLTQAAADAAAATQSRRVNGKLDLGVKTVGSQRVALRGPSPRKGTGVIDSYVRAGAPRRVATTIVHDADRRGGVLGPRASTLRDSFTPAAVKRAFTGVAEARNTALSRKAGLVTTIASAANGYSSGKSALKAWRDVAKNGVGGGRGDKAVTETASAVSSSANAAKAAVETRSMARQYATVRKNITQQLAKQPGVRKEAITRAARRSATAVVNGRGERATAKALRPALARGSKNAAAPIAKRALGAAATKPTSGAGRVVARALRPLGRAAAPAGKLLRPLGKVAAAPVAKTLVKVGARTALKAGGRFVPGMNVAIAAADTVTAIQTVRDPNASMGKKVTSVITAVGSIAAATNIPVVSQVGAGISAVSSFVGGWFS